MKRLSSLLLVAAVASLAAGSLGRAAGTVRCVGGPDCYPTLAAALAAANDGDTVRLAPGTYAGGVAIVHSITLQGAGAGTTIIAGGGPVLTLGVYKAVTEPTISIDGVTVTGGVTTTSAESRDQVGEDGVLAFGGGIDILPSSGLSGGATVSISNSVISDNEAAPTVTLGCAEPCDPFALAAGGGIYNAGRLTLRNTTVDRNTSGGPTASKAIGGGILSTPNGSSLTLEHATVSDNQVSVADPNGVQATGGGILSETGAFVVSNSVVTRNRAELTSTKVAVDGPFFANAAGIGCDRSATIANTRIDGNVVTVSDPSGQPAAFDSGLACGSSGGPATLENSSVSGNRVVASVADTTDSGPDGTAVEFDDTATISNTVIAGNTVAVTTTGGIAGAQGAVLNFAPDPSNPTTITNSVIKDNTMTANGGEGAASVQGGGIANTGALALRNVQVTGNRGVATGSGGFAQGAGVWNGSLFGSDATLLTLEQTAVTGNSLSAGSGVSIQGAGVYSVGFTVTFSHSLVARNSPDQTVWSARRLARKLARVAVGSGPAVEPLLREAPVMGEGSWVGLDVHARSVVAGVIEAGSGEVRSLRLPAGSGEAVAWLQTLAAPVRVVYEAGPTGYRLARACAEAGISCVVAAPSRVRAAADRVKTDRRDAERLARLLRLGEITPVRIPGLEEEAARDLVRAREDARGDLMRSRHRLSKLLLRHGLVYDATARTRTHDAWLRRQRFDGGPLAIVFDECYGRMLDAKSRRDTLDKAISELAATPPYVDVVERLVCLRGVSTLTAFALTVELGDWHRFRPESLGPFLGLTPSEHSSGERRRQGAITKAGNSHVRRLLIEAAWHQRPPSRRSVTLERRRAGKPLAVQAQAERSARRLHGRWHALESRGKPRTIVVVAVARELAGHCWAIATME